MKLTGFLKVGCRAAIGVLCLTIVVTACKSPRRTDPFTDAPYVTTDRLAEGRRVFDQNCHSCHPDGAGGLGPSLNDKPLPGWLIAFQVRRGLGVMPRFDPHKISNEELDSLVEYIRTLRRRGN
jgi:mono/diheme cytochrome c family protein